MVDLHMHYRHSKSADYVDDEAVRLAAFATVLANELDTLALEEGIFLIIY